jgi:hypothetical protein
LLNIAGLPVRLFLHFLGTIHLVYTFFTKKFFVKDSTVMAGMKTTYPLISRDTTVWKCWIGFNASHSFGAMFLGLINIYLATSYYSVLEGSFFILSLTLITSFSYLFLAKKYWFKIPFTGVLIATGCFILSILLIVLKES